MLRARVPEAWLPAPLRPPAARQAHLDVLVMLALARGQEAAGAGLSGEVRAWLEVQARPGEAIVTPGGLGRRRGRADHGDHDSASRTSLPKLGLTAAWAGKRARQRSRARACD